MVFKVLVANIFSTLSSGYKSQNLIIWTDNASKTPVSSLSLSRLVAGGLFSHSKCRLMHMKGKATP